MRRSTQYIVVHCSATPPGMDIGASEIDQWHRDKGWSGIGYAAVICRDGTIQFGRHFDAVGAHVKGYNTTTVGVCLVGGVDLDGKAESNYTREQFDSLRTLLFMLCRAYPDARVLGHRDLSPDVDGDGVIEPHEWLKECPCFDVSKWWEKQQQLGAAKVVDMAPMPPGMRFEPIPADTVEPPPPPPPPPKRHLRNEKPVKAKRPGWFARLFGGWSKTVA